jgi:hypothetical protein
MKRFIIPAAIAIAAILAAVWWFSPERALVRRTHNLLDTISFSQGTGKAARNLKTYALNGMLAESVVLDTPTITEANGEFDRSELESGFSWLCNQARRMEIKSLDVGSVEIIGNSGTVEMEIEALVELPSFRPADGIYDVVFEWRKDDDVWRLVRASWKERP